MKKETHISKARHAAVLTAAMLLCSLAQSMPCTAIPIAEEKAPAAAVQQSAAAAEEEPADDSDPVAEGIIGDSITWQLYANGLLQVTGSGDVALSSCPFGQRAADIKTAVIENTDNKHCITAIGNRMFDGCTNMTAITLPDTVTNIGAFAFRGCESLTEIALPEDLQEIGEQAFRGSGLTSLLLPGCTLVSGAFFDCNSLKTIVMQEGTTVIPPECFRHCDILESVSCPDSLKEIQCGYYGETGAFADCPALKTVSIGKNIESISRNAFRTTGEGLSVEFRDGVTAIPAEAFQGRTELGSVTLPATLLTVGKNAFYGCSNLTGVEFPKSLKEIGEQAFRGTGLTEAILPGCALGYAAFYDCNELKTLAIGEGTESIPSECFRHCDVLESAALPDSLKEIQCGYYGETGAFADCPALKTVSIGKNIESISRYAFRTTGEGLSVEFREGVTAIPAEAFQGRTELSSVTLPATLLTVGKNAFYGCSNLTGVVFPESLKEIGEQAFRGTGLTEAVLPGCALGYAAFYDCNELKTLAIGEGTESIPSECFRHCDVLESAYLPDSLKEILCGYYGETGAFADCPALKNVSIGKGIESISRYAFRTTGTGLSVEFREGVTAIPTEAFYGRTELTSISLPKTLETVGKNAFCECRNLSGVVFPESLKEIGEQAFRGTGLTEAILPGCALGYAAFYDCNELKTLVIGEGTESIPSECFRHCDALKEVILPDSVKEILRGYYSETGAFADCPALSKVSIGKGIETINDAAFRTGGTELEVTFREGVTAIPKNAFSGAPLTKVDLPESLDTLDESALSGCKDLLAVCFNGKMCIITDTENCLPASAIIFGYTESTAAAYAEKWGRVFIPLDAPDPDAPFSCDLNGDGKTDTEDTALLLRILAENGIKPEELPEKAVLYSADLDHNGILTLHDYKLLCAAVKKA